MAPVPARRKAPWIILAAGTLLAWGLLHRPGRRNAKDAAPPPPDGPLAPLGNYGADRLLQRLDAGTFQAPSGAFDRGESLLDSFSETQWRWDSPGRLPTAWVTLKEGEGRFRRRALVTPDRGAFEFPVFVPAGGRLETWCGSLSQGGRVRHVIERVGDNGGPEELFSSVIPGEEKPIQRFSIRRGKTVPEGAPRENPWRSARVDLSAWAGRTVRLRFRVEGSDVGQKGVLGVWGDPVVWGGRPSAPVPPRRPAVRIPAAGANVVLVVLEKARGDGVSLEGFSREIPPRLRDFFLEGVGVRRFYTNAFPAKNAWPVLWTSRFLRPGLRTPASGRAEGSWTKALQVQGYRTAAVGAFGAEDQPLLTDEPFDETHFLPNDGRSAPAAVRAAREWLLREHGRGPYLLTVYLRGAPAPRWPPLRFWPMSPRWFWEEIPSWTRVREAANRRYVDQEMGRLLSVLSSAPFQDTLVGVVSLTGEGGGERPFRRRGSNLRRARFSPDGGGLRENDIRGVWCLRHRSLPAGRLLSRPGQLVDVGPTVLALVGAGPAPSTDGRALDFRRESPLEESAGHVAVRGPGVKALLVDGHIKYIRHGKPARRPGIWRADYPREEVFDLWSDPAERKNLAVSRRSLLARLRQTMVETDPDPTDIFLGFRGMAGMTVQGAVACSVQGLRVSTATTVPVSGRGGTEFSFVVSSPTADVYFETDPPGASYMMSVLSNGRFIPASQWRVSRFGLPLFEANGDTWHDRIKFAWMEGWPSVDVSTPTVFLGRRERDPEVDPSEERRPVAVSAPWVPVPELPRAISPVPRAAPPGAAPVAPKISTETVVAP